MKHRSKTLLSRPVGISTHLKYKGKTYLLIVSGERYLGCFSSFKVCWTSLGIG